MSAHFRLGKSKASLLGAIALAATALGGAVQAAEGGAELKHVEWDFESPLGTFDRAALQRGFQVYKEVCASCHTLEFITFGNLDDAGGPGFSAAEAKALAAGYEKDVLDSTGETKQVPRTVADTFPAPFANENAARAANGGALPPDLSLMAKARKGGPNYIYSLLTGYAEAPAGTTLRTGMSYNTYFPGHQIAMAPPLSDGRVTYADNTPATVDQMAKDVVTFLTWASEPKMEERKRLGLSVLAYLGLLTIFLYWSKKRIWKNAH